MSFNRLYTFIELASESQDKDFLTRLQFSRRGEKLLELHMRAFAKAVHTESVKSSFYCTSTALQYSTVATSVLRQLQTPHRLLVPAFRSFSASSNKMGENVSAKNLEQCPVQHQGLKGSNVAGGGTRNRDWWYVVPRGLPSTRILTAEQARELAIEHSKAKC